MAPVIITLYVLAAVLPIIGFARLLWRAQRGLRATLDLVESRGHVTATMGDLNSEYADITTSPRTARNDILWDTILVGIGLAAGAVASIMSLSLSPTTAAPNAAPDGWAIVSGVVAIVAVLVAAGSLLVAARAERRARDAHVLQDRIDARQREFTDVDWTRRWVPADGGILFELSNTGLTDANEVTVVIDLPDGKRYLAQLGDIPSGGNASATPFSSRLSDELAAAVLDRQDWLGYTVRWATPLGTPDVSRKHGHQLF